LPDCKTYWRYFLVHINNSLRRGLSR
jgi:hypothetical protein